MSETTEKQTCPRRTGELGPWNRDEGQDEWLRTRWAPTREDADRQVAEFTARHPGGSMGDPMWPGEGEQPRTCSFCGGIHPDDAIALVEQGWVVLGTDKGYKRYMAHPTRGQSFIPPVKLYTMHFDEDQVARFNLALAKSAA